LGRLFFWIFLVAARVLLAVRPGSSWSARSRAAADFAAEAEQIALTPANWR
jgi:hypothetical protein